MKENNDRKASFFEHFLIGHPFLLNSGKAIMDKLLVVFFQLNCPLYISLDKCYLILSFKSCFYQKPYK